MPNQLQISCVCCGICFASFNPQEYCSGDCGFNAREEKIIQEWGEGDAF